jgi:neutral amino acid transport system permease protein
MEVSYLVFLIIYTGLFAIFALGLNLQWGFAGLINFGHVAFMLLGAYTTVLLTLKGVPIILATISGLIVAALLGLIIGFSTLRLREDYLAIVTIGVAELLRLIANNEQWLTGGPFGVRGYPLPLANFNPNFIGKLGMLGILTLISIFAGWQVWLHLKVKWRSKALITRSIWGMIASGLIILVYLNGFIAIYNYQQYDKAGLMLLVLVVLTLVYWGLETLVHSPWGRVLKAIREDEEIARALGKNVFWYKLQAFMLGGAIAGVSGSFLAWQLTNIYPTQSFEPIVTFNAWTMIVLGGAGNNAGAILGAIIFWAYDNLTRFGLQNISWIDSDRLGAFRMMLIGLILMVLMVWRPQGILGNKDELTLGK